MQNQEIDVKRYTSITSIFPRNAFLMVVFKSSGGRGMIGVVVFSSACIHAWEPSECDGFRFD